MLTVAFLNRQIERTQCPSWGPDGGRAGAPNRVTVLRAEGGEVSFPSGKLGSFPLRRGDRHVIEVGGGGGVGSPLGRPPEREHGVVLARRGDGRVGVDWEATRRLRQRQMAGLAGPEGGPEPRGVEG